MARTITIDVAGYAVEAPVIKSSYSDETVVMSLNGNQELTEHCAQKLLPYLDGCDVILSTESKGLALANSLSRLLGFPRFAVAKKSNKIYILEGLAISIRTDKGRIQNLRLDQKDVDLLRGKRVAIVDPVMSTGATLAGMEKLIVKAGGSVHSRNFVVVRESSPLRKDVNYLGILPDLD